MLCYALLGCLGGGKEVNERIELRVWLLCLSRIASVRGPSKQASAHMHERLLGYFERPLLRVQVERRQADQGQDRLAQGPRRGFGACQPGG